MGKPDLDVDELSPDARRRAVAEVLGRGVGRWKRFCLETVSETLQDSVGKPLEPGRFSGLSVTDAVFDRKMTAAKFIPSFTEVPSHESQKTQ
ncbi:hypothetical protein GCM10023156_19940 [Novipirellula rosea]|uniref:Uncharacterized protein n=1 Tax=Novipirellula rosea TaxID=1031540 RepID=A0ABP8MMK5_9BACT